MIYDMMLVPYILTIYIIQYVQVVYNTYTSYFHGTKFLQLYSIYVLVIFLTDLFINLIVAVSV